MNPALLLAGLAELAKLQAFASLIALSLGRGIAFVPASLAFIAALGLGRVLRWIEWRGFAYALAEALGLGSSLLLARLAAGGAGGEAGPAGADGVALVLNLLAVAGFWARGAWLGSREPEHRFCLLRFDEGVALFLCVLSLEAAIGLPDPGAWWRALVFFVASIGAIGSARGRGAGRGGLARPSRAPVLGSATAVFLAAAVAIESAVPALREPAAMASGVLRRFFGAVVRVCASILLWIFSYKPASAPAAGGDSRSPAPAAPPAGSESSFARILVYVIEAAALLVAAAIAAYGVAQLLRSLVAALRGMGLGRAWAIVAARLRGLARRWFAAARRLARLLPRPGRRRSPAVAAYAALLSRGRSVGLGRRRSETPREFAGRLEAALPRSAARALFVVEALEREEYGGLPTDAETARELLRARRGMSRLAFRAERLRRGLRRG